MINLTTIRQGYIFTVIHTIESNGHLFAIRKPDDALGGKAVIVGCVISILRQGMTSTSSLERLHISHKTSKQVALIAV